MKGVPEAPQCGFSGGMVQILNSEGLARKLATSRLDAQRRAVGVKFDAYNVLADEELRNEIKAYS